MKAEVYDEEKNVDRKFFIFFSAIGPNKKEFLQKLDNTTY
jgi:hypothetical protein